ncbi:MAG: HAD-IIB family hydrolase [Patescibacteria group bacterium]
MAESNKIPALNNYKKLSKKIVMFDLDGTLTESKADLDKEMASLLCKLLEKKIVTVIGGGNYPQFEKQFLSYLKCPKERLKNLFILPTSGGRMYKYDAGKWRLVYKNTLTTKEKGQVLNAFKRAFRDINYTSPKKTYGKVIEDRESQITFSALGQKAPLAQKEKWNKKLDIRSQLKAALEKYLSKFEVRLGGLTSIDVTKKGIDKAYGVAQIMKLFKIWKRDVLYIGDALFKGGNDYVVKRTGIATLKVTGCEKTKTFIRFLIHDSRQKVSSPKIALCGAFSLQKAKMRQTDSHQNELWKNQRF